MTSSLPVPSQESAPPIRRPVSIDSAVPVTTWNLRDIPPAVYKLDSDGRKWRAACKQRRSVALQLASHADRDGAGIWVGRERLALSLGLSVRETDYLLADLIELRFLRNEGWRGQNKKRSLDLHAIFQKWRQRGLAQNSSGGLLQNRAGDSCKIEGDFCKIEPGLLQNSSGRQPPVLDLHKKPSEGEGVDGTRARAERPRATASLPLVDQEGKPNDDDWLQKYVRR